MKSITRYWLLASLTLFYSATYSLGQSLLKDLLPDFDNITPSVSALGSYLNKTSSKYTGVADIQIPLYVAKSGNIQVPISLCYDASGIKVNQEATFVGLGWNLNMGGCITEVVNGTKDADYTRVSTDSCNKIIEAMRPSGYYPSYTPYSYIVGSNCNVDGEFYRNSAKIYERALLVEELSKGFYNPDIFQANFCGHNFSFIVNDYKKRQVTVIDTDETKYSINYSSNKIDITDDTGKKYTFVYYQTDDIEGKGRSYYLKTIEDINGYDRVDFSYRSQRQYASFSFNQSLIRIDNSSTSDLPPEIQAVINSSNHIETSGRSNYNYTYYPSEIETPQERIVFSWIQREDIQEGLCLSEITVYSKNGNRRTHNTLFDYDYFLEKNRYERKITDLNLGSTPLALKNYIPKRLKLRCVSVDNLRYKFDYNESISLPYRTSCSVDYWGYYNGIDNHEGLCSTPMYRCISDSVVKVKNYLGNSNRRASAQYGACGTLQKMTYPTGGYSVYEYENNHFNDYYYFPSASFIVEGTSKIMKEAYAIGYSKNANNQTEVLDLKKETTVDFRIDLYSDNPQEKSYIQIARVKEIQPAKFVSITYETSQEHLSGTYQFSKKMPAGVYLIKAHAPYRQGGYNLVARCLATYSDLSKLQFDYSSRDNSGESIGCGLRIKTISNYNFDNQLLSKTDYEYYDGKLHEPVDNLEQCYLYCGKNKSVNYSYCNSEPSNMYVCRMGVAPIGYSKIKETTYSKQEQVEKIVYRIFHNDSYEKIGDRMYYFPNKGLNGREKKVALFDSDNNKLKEVEYIYSNKISKPINFLKSRMLASSLVTNGDGPDQWNVMSLSVFPKYFNWIFVEQEMETQYCGGIPQKSIITKYAYNDSNYKISCREISQGYNAKEDRYQYPVDGVSAGSDLLINKHVLSRLTGTRQYLNGKLTGGAQLEFRERDTLQHDSIPVVEMFRNILPSGKMDTVLTVVDYDERGNIREYVTKNGTHTTILWSYNYQYPVMQIVGATYEEVKNVSSAVETLGSRSALPVGLLKDLHNKVSGIRDNGLQVTAYVYDPWYGVSDIIQPNGKVMHYDKDSQGRLSKILEDSAMGPVVQRFFYHYRNRRI